MIVKPTKLGVLRRVSAGGEGYRLWITALGAFDLLSPGDFLPEARLWQTAAPALGATPLDAGMPKPRAEVLVAGDVCAPRNRPVRNLMVNLELGSIQKRLVAFGRRWWRYGPDGPVMSEPEPFERVRLGWENAFGGPGFADNPLGTGVEARKLMTQRIPAELPRIETPATLILNIDHHPAPTGLGPRPEDAPGRIGFAGTYDDAWLRDGFPGHARDFDWRYYNTACPDQQTDVELSGNERYRLTGMHPDHAEFQGRLPGFRVRAFARQGEAFIELPMRCDTVWFFPNAALGIVLFRGGLMVQDREAGSVSDVLLAYERLSDPPRPPDHYRTALNERTDPETAALKFFDERPLKPERLPEEIAAVEAERQAIREENAKRDEQAREHALATAFRTAGLPMPPAALLKDDPPLPVQIPVVTPGEIERLEVDMSALVKTADALQDYTEKQRKNLLAQTERELQRATQAFGQIDPQVRPLLTDPFRQVSKNVSEALGKNIDLVPPPSPATPSPLSGVLKDTGEFLKKRQPEAALPAPSDPFKQAEGLLKKSLRSTPAKAQTKDGMSLGLYRARQRALGAIDEEDPLTKSLAQLDEMQATQKRVGKQAAEAMEQTRSALPSPGTAHPAPPAPPDAPINPFETALQTLRSESLAKEPAAKEAAGKLSAALSHPGVEYLTGVVHATKDKASPPSELTASDISDRAEAGFAEAREKIEQAREEFETLSADGRRASPEPMAPEEPLSPEDAQALGLLALELARGRAGLRERDLAGADLTGADLAGLDLSGIFLERAVLKGANLAGANLHRAVLTGADLTGADLTQTDLTEANLSNANLTEARLGEARLDKANLYRSQLDRADLSRARLSAVNPVEARLTDARLTAAELRDVSFLKCDLAGVVLDEARLHSVTFLETRLTGLSARAARFERCALVGLDGDDADLTGLEFINSACIGDARLHRARLTGLVAPGSGWRGADMREADLTAAHLDEADLGETNLAGACLHRASLKRAVLHKADCTGANFFGATLLEAQAQAADFTQASFHMANLYSTDLSDAVLTLCDLTGANLAYTVMTRPANAE